MTDPRGQQVCRRFPLRPRPAGVFEVKVRWCRNYPNRSSATYRVRFFLGATRLGPVLTFRLR